MVNDTIEKKNWQFYIKKFEPLIDLILFLYFLWTLVDFENFENPVAGYVFLIILYIFAAMFYYFLPMFNKFDTVLHFMSISEKFVGFIAILKILNIINLPAVTGLAIFFCSLFIPVITDFNWKKEEEEYGTEFVKKDKSNAILFLSAVIILVLNMSFTESYPPTIKKVLSNFIYVFCTIMALFVIFRLLFMNSDSSEDQIEEITNTTN